MCRYTATKLRGKHKRSYILLKNQRFLKELDKIPYSEEEADQEQKKQSLQRRWLNFYQSIRKQQE